MSFASGSKVKVEQLFDAVQQYHNSRSEGSGDVAASPELSDRCRLLGLTDGLGLLSVLQGFNYIPYLLTLLLVRSNAVFYYYGQLFVMPSNLVTLSVRPRGKSTATYALSEC